MAIDNTGTTVGVAGAGAIGSAVTRTLLTAGWPVVVHNRTPDRVAPLAAAGAEPAASMSDLVARSNLLLVCLTDYDAVHALLRDAPEAPWTGRTVATLTTGTPQEAEALTEQLAALGAAHLDVGVQSAPEAVGTERARFLVSGPDEVVRKALPVLSALGTVTVVGESVGAAAAWDLALFGLWYDAQVGLLRALDVARTIGFELEPAARDAAAQLGHVVDAAAQTAAEVGSGDHPAGSASLTEHARLLPQLLAQRRGGPLGDGGLDRITGLVKRRVARGDGERGLTAVLDEGTPRPPSANTGRAE